MRAREHERGGRRGGNHPPRFQSFDLLILDFMMPRTDGMGVLEHLRSRPGRAPQVIVMTAAVPATTDRSAGANRGTGDEAIRYRYPDANRRRRGPRELVA